MSSYTVINNTNLPLHAATKWANIVQQFKNNIPPGSTAEVPAETLGASDFFVVIGTPQNEFDHSHDVAAFLGLAKDCISALTAIGKVAMTLSEDVAEDGAVTVAEDGVPLVAIAEAAEQAAMIANEAKKAGKAIKKVFVDIHAAPVDANGHVCRFVEVADCYNPDGYTITMTGGEVKAVVPDGSGRVQIQNVTDLKMHWVNNKTHTHGTGTLTTS